MAVITKGKQSAGERQAIRLRKRIKALGGTIPQPWPWSVVKRYRYKGHKVVVDAALYNLQLLELVEDLEKQKRREVRNGN